jgi:hypothetical protein
MAGSIPGPLGLVTVAAPAVDAGTSAVVAMPVPGVAGVAAPKPPVLLDAHVRILAATAYGEGSGLNVFEEMAAIANVLVRQQKARNHPSITSFIHSDKTFAFAAHDGNQRFKKLIEASAAAIASDSGMSAAVAGALNALSEGGMDYSNGAYFWDGADIKSNYANHAKVKDGILITQPSHNIYNIESKQVPGENWWLSATGQPTKLRGKWTHKFESTAAHGGTIFWKYNDDFIKATGNKAYK